MRNSEKGFTVVEVLIAVAVVIVIGIVGWLVYDRQNSTSGNHQKPVTKTEIKTADDQADPNQELDTKEYVGKLISFQHPVGWVESTEEIANVDEVVILKTSDYKAEVDSTDRSAITAGALVKLSVSKTSASSVQEVKAPFIRGSVMQRKIENNEVKFKDITIAGIKAVEFDWRYESDGARYVEFVSDGLFVHAVLDTAGSETAHAAYQQFIALLGTIKE